jgi:hypothetical protein
LFQESRVQLLNGDDSGFQEELAEDLGSRLHLWTMGSGIGRKNGSRGEGKEYPPSWGSA